MTKAETITRGSIADILKQAGALCDDGFSKKEHDSPSHLSQELSPFRKEFWFTLVQELESLPNKRKIHFARFINFFDPVKNPYSRSYDEPGKYSRLPLILFGDSKNSHDYLSRFLVFEFHPFEKDEEFKVLIDRARFLMVSNFLDIREHIAFEKNKEVAPEIYCEYLEKIYRYAVNILRDSDDAWDVVQLTFKEVFGDLKLNERDSLRHWIFKIAKNRIIDFKRSHRTVQFSTLPLHNEEEDLLFRDEGLNPHEILEKKEARSILRGAISTLPNHEYLITILAVYFGLSGAEISRLVGIKENTVKTWLFRAKKHLRENPDLQSLIRA